MKHCGKKKTNPVSCTDWYNNCLFTVKQTQLACLGTYLLLFFFFPFCCSSQSTKSFSDLEYKLSNVLFHRCCGQSYPLEKNNRDLTACWFYSAVIKGQAAQKEAYHWIPCHVFQWYKRIPALIFSSTLCETDSEEKGEKNWFLFLRINIHSLLTSTARCAVFRNLSRFWEGFFLYQC